jgi:hypothetical protein
MLPMCTVEVEGVHAGRPKIFWVEQPPKDINRDTSIATDVKGLSC